MRNLILTVMLCLAGACVPDDPVVSAVEAELRMTFDCRSYDGGSVQVCCASLQISTRGIYACVHRHANGVIHASVDTYEYNEPIPSDGWTQIEVPKHGLVRAECWNDLGLCWFPADGDACVYDQLDDVVQCPLDSAPQAPPP